MSWVCVCVCVCVFMCVEGAFTKNRVRLTQSIVVKLSQTQAKQFKLFFPAWLVNVVTVETDIKRRAEVQVHTAHTLDKNAHANGSHEAFSVVLYKSY